MKITEDRIERHIIIDCYAEPESACLDSARDWLRRTGEYAGWETSDAKQLEGRKVRVVLQPSERDQDKAYRGHQPARVIDLVLDTFARC